MSNQFDFIKKKIPKNLDEFIEGANAVESATIAKKRVVKKDIKLTITGKMKRESCEKKPFMLYIRKDIANDLDEHCQGTKQAIINYLLRTALDSLIKNGELLVEDIG